MAVRRSARKAAQVNRLGDLMFGRSSKLELSLWVMRHERRHFYLSQAARGTGRSVPTVASALEDMVGLGMLRKFHRPKGAGPRWYRRTYSPLWRIVKEAAAVLPSVPDAAELDSLIDWQPLERVPRESHG